MKRAVIRGCVRAVSMHAAEAGGQRKQISMATTESEAAGPLCNCRFRDSACTSSLYRESGSTKDKEELSKLSSCWLSA